MQSPFYWFSYADSLLPTGFVPPPDTGQTQVRLELTPGSQFADTLKTAEYARSLIRIILKLKHHTTIGGGAGSDPFAGGASSEPRKATLTIQTTERADRSASLQDIEDQIRQRLAPLPGARFRSVWRAITANINWRSSGDDP